MDDENKGDARQANRTLIPLVDFVSGCIEDVFAKHQGDIGCPTKEGGIEGVSTGGQEPGMSIDGLKVDHLAAISW